MDIGKLLNKLSGSLKKITSLRDLRLLGVAISKIHCNCETCQRQGVAISLLQRDNLFFQAT